MTKRKVFYSFHYDNDVFRVQQIRNMGIIDGNEPVTPNNWEEIKRQGDISIRNWINNEISKSSCVVVLVGSQTSCRKWVNYEIQQALEQKKGLLGIYIHNLKDPRTGIDTKGKNPFSLYTSTINGVWSNYEVIYPSLKEEFTEKYPNIELLPNIFEEEIIF